MLRPNYTNLGKKLVCRAASSYSKNTGNNIPNTWQSYKIRPNLKADTKVAVSVSGVDSPHSIFLRTAKRCNFCKSLSHIKTDCPKFKEEEKNIAESLRAKVSILDLPIPPFQQLERGENDYIPAEIFNKPLFKGKYQLRFLCSHATLEACKQANHAITVKKFGAILTISEFTNPEG
uniref:Uncharacterized protein n=1 Tax=Ditylenchus dipsaci TaxID=166011 RepID=A0A915CTN5_9BILA